MNAVPDTNALPMLPPEERVLSTLENDGSRRWLTPKLSRGPLWRRRRVVAYALIAVYAVLPFLTIGGRQALQLDLWAGRFYFFGLEIRPTDLELLAVFGLLTFLTIFCATAVVGRVWCGWACPQTVYLEFVFRPIERFFTGTTGKGGKPRRSVAAWRTVAIYATFLVICWHLANTFLAYFVGSATLHEWIWTQPPWRHPGAFALVAAVTGLMLFDFCYWREQLCIIGCPYGRFQSVLLDRSSLIVGYDERRGEPRGRGRDRDAKGLGSCVDCSLCVDVCPTGIDIRDGLQLECVNCTQCIDACDEVMDRTGQPRGLIRYSSQQGLEGHPTRVLRPRLFVYAGAIALLSGLLAYLVVSRAAFDVTLLRGLGRPFVVRESGEIENLVRVKLVNRTETPQAYRITADTAGVRVDGGVEQTLEPGATNTTAVQIVTDPSLFGPGGTLDAVIRVADGEGHTIGSTYRLFGPSQRGSANPTGAKETNR